MVLEHSTWPSGIEHAICAPELLLNDRALRCLAPMFLKCSRILLKTHKEKGTTFFSNILKLLNFREISKKSTLKYVVGILQTEGLFRNVIGTNDITRVPEISQTRIHTITKSETRHGKGNGVEI